MFIDVHGERFGKMVTFPAVEVTKLSSKELDAAGQLEEQLRPLGLIAMCACRFPRAAVQGKAAYDFLCGITALIYRCNPADQITRRDGEYEDRSWASPTDEDGFGTIGQRVGEMLEVKETAGALSAGYTMHYGADGNPLVSEAGVSLALNGHPRYMSAFMRLSADARTEGVYTMGADVGYVLHDGRVQPDAAVGLVGLSYIGGQLL